MSDIDPAPLEWEQDKARGARGIGDGRNEGDRRRGLGKPDEIVRAVVFPAAEEAGFVTGSTLSINGGQHMS